VKSTSSRLICPVPGIALLLILIILSACSSNEEAEKMVPRDVIEPQTASAEGITGFSFEPSPPDTVLLEWSGIGTASIIEIIISSDQEIQEGDTLLKLREEIHTVERERLTMELDIAVAMLPSDSLLQFRVDSLSQLLDSLQRSEYTFYLSPLNAAPVAILVETGQIIRHGAALLELSVASSELFIVYPPEGSSIDFWPPGPGVRLVEERDGYSVYSGELPALEVLFKRLMAVPREAVFESELDSYIITVMRDTIPVFRAGEMENNLVIILPQEPLVADLRTWAEK
jgi:hypothetical protein